MYSKQKSLNFGHYVPNDKVLNKKIPENPKYKHVKPAIDTGKNIRKHIDDLKEKQKNCIYKKDEVFKRIKVITFLKLVVTCASEIANNENDGVNQPCNSTMPETSGLPERRCIANVLMGVGELDVINSRKKVHSAPAKLFVSMPYLLLDVRDRDAFSQCHIKTAKHYPSAMLSRSISYETEDLKFYKNHSNTVIILYDDDEATAIRVATTLVERGYENVYLLTGGLKVALEICPHGLTTSSQISPLHMLTHGATSHIQKNSGKEYFSQDDIAAIQYYVDCPVKGNSSALSSQSSQSRMGKSVGNGHRSSSEYTAGTSCSLSTTDRECPCKSSTMQQKQKQSVTSKSSRASHAHSNCTKSMEQMQFKPVIDDKARKLKRAPWK